jgi:hypothetical protein
MKKIFILALLALSVVTSAVQAQIQTDPEKRAAEIRNEKNKATQWVAGLNLNDPAKEARVIDVITTHIMAVRDWHNTHPVTEVPDGINPRFPGTRMSGAEKQVFINSTKPASVHKNLMDGLRADLTEAQVEQILDEYTIKKVAFTMNAYRECILDLTPEEDAALLGILKKWREQAVDYKNMEAISAIFEIAKTECELWLYQHDRNFKKLYAEWAVRRKAAQAAAAKK